ncbi:DUF4397 domain-containing protein [Blastococcus brunescens]|uniref:DUF4397 domain-containing protein n=1 Tax=Blastococcus brunescens TaxID=1564165 RepID=A0ABZ1AZM6_9ACTN|nr:DUF4397 domain-containing protein [Blastococcus sp. BMG 8361]WRL64017.1 DUF4397 domain-containing protein [Blastococcus sp. BMG 8361]
MITTRSSFRAAGVVGTAGALVLLATPALADNHTATVSVLHAVPDLPVDVYANGERLIDDFQPGTLTDPLQLPAGSYDLALFPADAADGSGEPLLSADGVAVPAGANATVVAHLTAEGQPALTPFVNDTSAVPAGEARVTVRHTAAAPAVDVRAGGTVVVPGLENPNEASLTVPAGTVSADVVVAGTETVAIGPADLTSPRAPRPSPTRGVRRRPATSWPSRRSAAPTRRRPASPAAPPAWWTTARSRRPSRPSRCSAWWRPAQAPCAWPAAMAEPHRLQ